MTDDALIDRFVEVLNARGFESLPQEEVSLELRTGSVEPSEWCDWGDSPIVQIDHEDILSRNRKGRIVAEIAPSFRQFVQGVIAGEIV
jgi:hypothetical protein